MVTRQEYNKALDIIEEYHMQLFNGNIEKNRDNGKTKLGDWIKTQATASRRLITIATQNEEYYLEDINKRNFLMFRHAGIKTWEEFKKLSGYIE